MLNDKNQSLCWDVLAKYGTRNQRRMIIEECAELQKAVCKLFREPDNNEYYRNYIEELVDVIVMCQQMLLAENISMDDVNAMAGLKLVRALGAGDEY